jgi:hypothetical protein
MVDLSFYWINDKTHLHDLIFMEKGLNQKTDEWVRFDMDYMK